MAKIDVTPVNDRIVVIPVEEARGILYIPSTVKTEKPEEGYVLAIDSKIENPICKVGDKIVFNKFATTPLKYKGKDGVMKDYLIMMESSVLGIINIVNEAERKDYLKNNE